MTLQTALLMIVTTFATVAATTLQTIVLEWFRRRATPRAREQIAAHVVERMNGATSDRPTPREGKP